MRNGPLEPSMFTVNSIYRFYWICRSCGRSYRASIGNRRKVNPDVCPLCFKKSRFPHPTLRECYPRLEHFWNKELNPVPFSEVSAASEQYGIFDGPDGRILPVRISNLSNWLRHHPDKQPEEYFLLQL